MQTNIKNLRKDFNISQFELARDTNLTKSTISSWENGTRIPSAKAIIVLSRYFQVSTDYILCLSNDNKVVHKTDDLDVDISLFSNRLKSLRDTSKLSLYKIESITKISKSALFAWEHSIGIPNAQAIVTLAKFFGVTTDYLLGET